MIGAQETIFGEHDEILSIRVHGTGIDQPAQIDAFARIEHLGEVLADHLRGNVVNVLVPILDHRHADGLDKGTYEQGLFARVLVVQIKQ